MHPAIQSGFMRVLQLQLALSSMSAALQAAQARLESVDSMRIPALEERLQEVSRNTAEVGNTDCKSAQFLSLHLTALQSAT